MESGFSMAGKFEEFFSYGRASGNRGNPDYITDYQIVNCILYAKNYKIYKFLYGKP